MVLKNRDLASLSLVEFSGTFNILFHLSSSKGTILIITNVVIISLGDSSPVFFICFTRSSYLPSLGRFCSSTNAVKESLSMFWPVSTHLLWYWSPLTPDIEPLG